MQIHNRLTLKPNTNPTTEQSTFHMWRVNRCCWF